MTGLFKKPTIWTWVVKLLQIAKSQNCKLIDDSSWFNIHWTGSTVLENWMKVLKNRGLYTALVSLTKTVTAQTWPSRVSDY